MILRELRHFPRASFIESSRQRQESPPLLREPSSAEICIETWTRVCYRLVRSLPGSAPARVAGANPVF
jgi:hypothetical protein